MCIQCASQAGLVLGCFCFWCSFVVSVFAFVTLRLSLRLHMHPVLTDIVTNLSTSLSGTVNQKYQRHLEGSNELTFSETL